MMKKKIKKKDGTTVEVDETYQLQEGESFVEDVSVGEALKSVGEKLAVEMKTKLEEFQKQTAEEQQQTLETFKADFEKTVNDKLSKMPINAPDFMKTFSESSAVAAERERFKLQNREKFAKAVIGGPYVNSHIVNFDTWTDGDPINKFVRGLQLLKNGDSKADTYLHYSREDYKKRMTDLTGGQLETYAQSVGTDADGGYLSPPEFELMVLMQLGKYGLFRRFVPVFPTATVTQNLTALDSAVSAYWVNELSEITNSQFALSRPTNALNKLGVLITGSREFWEDPQEVRNTIDSITAEVMDKALDTQWLVGTGSPFTGVASVSGGQDEVIGGTTVDGTLTLTEDDITNCIYKLEDYNSPGAIWVHNKLISAEIAKIKDGDNRSIYKRVPSMMGDGAGITQGMLEGYPVYHSSVMPGTSPGANTVFSVLFDPKQVTRARSRAGIIVEEFNTGTDQASVNLLTKDARTLRFIYRISIHNFVKEDIDGSQTAVARLKTAAA